LYAYPTVRVFTQSRFSDDHAAPRPKPKQRQATEQDEYRPPSQIGHEKPTGERANRRPEQIPEGNNAICDTHTMGSTPLAMSLDKQGNVALSPTPSNSRSAIKAGKELTNPVSNVATDQIAIPAASTLCAP
jgi:hypothetical protein